MLTRNSLAVVLSLGGLAAAQLSLSSDCTSALTSVLSNSDASTCLSLDSAVSILTLPANTSVIPSVNTWLGSMCAAVTCSDSTLDSITSTVLTGCQSDMQSSGAVPAGASLDMSNAQQDVVAGYPSTRDVACSQTANTYCLVNTLNAVQSMTGTPLSLNYIMTADWASLANTLNTTTLCNDCNQNAYTTLLEQVPAVQGSDFETVLASRCGSAFVSGAVPDDISDGLFNNNNNTKSDKNKSNAALGLGIEGGLYYTIIGSAGFVGAMFL